jgi:hypothetical protein
VRAIDGFGCIGNLGRGLARCRWLRWFDADEAARLNQSRGFVLRLDVLAKLPLTEAWFPDIGRADQGVIVLASARLQEELSDLAMNLIRRRRALIQMRGL